MFPGERTLGASPTTTITFRGADADAFDDIVVTGSRSGRHEGRLVEHADGEGAAFVPGEPFAPGERVTVEAGRIDGGESSFLISRTLTGKPPPYDVAKPATDRRVQAFRTRPDLRPPQIAVTVQSAAASAGDIFIAPKRGATQVGPMIVDEAGQLVWFRKLEDNLQAFDFRAQEYQGKPVLTWWEGRMALYRGAGVGRIVDRSYREVATVRAANGYDFDAHEFVLTPAGTALLMSYVPVPWDLSDMGGRRDGVVEDNVVQEIDVATGELLFEWHALGTINLGESYRPAPAERGQMHDPFHFNSVTLDNDGDLLVSARHTGAIYKVDRSTGDIVWRLGGKRSDFELAPGAEFAVQHDAERRADGAITLFDNVAEDLPARGRRSRALALRLDEDDETATVDQWWEHTGSVLSATQGSTQSLAGGGTFVGWGGLQPYFSEFSADGRMVFDARFVPDGVETYRAYRHRWNGAGEGEPTAVARGSTVYASWNGASAVTRWRVKAGGQPVSETRTGFETAIRLPGTADGATVEALDASGKVLGTAVAEPAG